MSDQPDNGQPNGWERKTLERLAFEGLREQRRSRRWGIFFKLAAFAYITFLLVVAVDWRGDSHANTPHTSIVDLNGVIDSTGENNADHITAALEGAFRDRNTRGVILRINSPGGSPVQAGIIYDEIKRLRGMYPNIPLYAVVEDICASGGYYIAAAADRIYVDKASIIGSIGVIMDGWGFTGTMDKLGVERRVLASGENKDFMDPFQPADPKQTAHAQEMINDIYQQFIDAVRKGRGKRLKETPDMFSGLMWTGEKSVELGISDGLGSVDYVAREVIKAEDVVDYTQKDNIAERFAKRLGASAATTFGNLLLKGGVSLH